MPRGRTRDRPRRASREVSLTLYPRWSFRSQARDAAVEVDGLTRCRTKTLAHNSRGARISVDQGFTPKEALPVDAAVHGPTHVEFAVRFDAFNDDFSPERNGQLEQSLQLPG